MKTLKNWHLKKSKGRKKLENLGERQRRNIRAEIRSNLEEWRATIQCSKGNLQEMAIDNIPSCESTADFNESNESNTAIQNVRFHDEHEPNLFRDNSSSFNNSQFGSSSSTSAECESVSDSSDDFSGRIFISEKFFDSTDTNDSIGEKYSNDSDMRHETFREQLRLCFLSEKINLKQGTAILKLLKSHPCFSSLPKDCRTLY